jgi:tetratricopeptide (TPR) repeat protein
MAPGFHTARSWRIAIIVAAMTAAVPPLALANDPVLAQDSGTISPKQQKKLPEAPGKLPKVGADKTRGLDFLFGALKAAPDEASAKHVEARIWAQWLQTPSDTTALLMTRAKAAIDAQQVDVALKLLDAVIKLRPDYIEGWNRRATLYYLKNDYALSLRDIEQVLIREPRHFGALAGLGMIMQDLGDDKRALDAFRKALAINPHLEKVPELVKTLSEKVEGRDI